MDLKDIPMAGDAAKRQSRRFVLAGGAKVSVTLEKLYWENLDRIAGLEEVELRDVVLAIEASRLAMTLTEALRAFALAYYRQAVVREAQHPEAERTRAPAGLDLIVTLVLANLRGASGMAVH